MKPFKTKKWLSTTLRWWVDFKESEADPFPAAPIFNRRLKGESANTYEALVLEYSLKNYGSVHAEGVRNIFALADFGLSAARTYGRLVDIFFSDNDRVVDVLTVTLPVDLEISFDVA